MADQDESNAEFLLLKEVAGQIRGKCLCALGEFSIEAVLSGMERFPEDFTADVAMKETYGENS